jgi:uncharacterized protein (DUF302 family)
MTPYTSRKSTASFEETIAKVTTSLQEQGFGIVTSMDLKDIFKKKLDAVFRNYKILGACNPQFAFKAISTEPHVGLMLPCNIVVQEHENGEVEVSAINPMETIDKVFPSAGLAALATEVSERLRIAMDNI